MHPVAFDDPRWQQRAVGYGVPYDPRPALEALTVNYSDGQAWADLRNNLHHQGSVGEASYLALPTLVALAEQAGHRDWNVYAFVAVIEVARHRRSNPTVPTWLAPTYTAALASVVRLALANLEQTTDPYGSEPPCQ